MSEQQTPWGPLPDWFNQELQNRSNDQDWSRRFEEQWREMEEPPRSMVDFIDNHTSFGMKVVDIGCGNGRATLLLAENGCRVVAMDRCLTGIERTIQRLEEAGLSAKVIVADFDDLPILFDKSECQAAIASQVLQLPGCWAKIKEVWNYISWILQIDAYLYVRVRSINNQVNPRRQVFDVYGDDESEIAQIGTNVQNRNGQVRHNYSIEEILFLAKKYGFEIIGKITEERNIPSIHENCPDRHANGAGVLQWVAVLNKIRNVGLAVG